jgi:hypothetical protein
MAMYSKVKFLKASVVYEDRPESEKATKYKKAVIIEPGTFLGEIDKFTTFLSPAGIRLFMVTEDIEVLADSFVR